MDAPLLRNTFGIHYGILTNLTSLIVLFTTVTYYNQTNTRKTDGLLSCNYV